MPKRPKPPEPFKTWLDAVLSPGSYVIPQSWRSYARAELEELRNELELLEATANETAERVQDVG